MLIYLEHAVEHHSKRRVKVEQMWLTQMVRGRPWDHCQSGPGGASSLAAQDVCSINEAGTEDRRRNRRIWGSTKFIHKITQSPALTEKQPIVLAYLQFQMKVGFWCLFVLMHDFRTSIKRLLFSVGAESCNILFLGALPIHLIRHTCCRMYCLAIMHSITDRQQYCRP